MPGYAYGSAAYGSASSSGYGYTTIATGLKGAATTSKRSRRSNTFSWFPNGYTVVTGGKVLDKPSSSTHQAKSSRHRAESGPPWSIFSPLHSGVTSPLSKVSLESPRQSRAAELDLKQVRDGYRRSTASRSERPRYRKSSAQKQNMRKKSHSERKDIPRQSFASLTSRGTATPTMSERQRRQIKAMEGKKSKGSYGLFSCFGR